MNCDIDKKINKLIEYYESTGDNVVSVGFGNKIKSGLATNENSIIFTVEKKIPISDLKQNEIIPSSIVLDGEEFKTDVVEGTYKFLFSQWGVDPYNDNFWPSNREKIRPLRGGISATNFTALSNSTGTLGLIAVDNNTNSLVGVSNAHVLIDDASICSDRNPDLIKTNVANHVVVQPNEANNSNINNSIGIVKRYLPIRSDVYNYADVALCTVSQADIDSSSHLQHGLNYSTFMPFATTQEIDNLLISNPDLFSSGRTTGAKGEGVRKLKMNEFVAAIWIPQQMQGSVSYAAEFASVLKFVATEGSTLYGFPIDRGDSGSALVAEINGIRKVIGLVFAGLFNSQNVCVAGLANRIDHVANLMQISAWDGSSNYCFSAGAPVEQHLVDGLDNRDYIDIGNKRFWQIGLVANEDTGNATPTPTPTQNPQATPTPTPAQNPEATPTPTPAQNPEVTPTPTGEIINPVDPDDQPLPNTIDIALRSGTWGDPHYDVSITVDAGETIAILDGCTPAKVAASDANRCGLVRFNSTELGSNLSGDKYVALIGNYSESDWQNYPSDNILPEGYQFFEITGTSENDFKATHYVPNWITHTMNSSGFVDNGQEIQIRARTSSILDTENYGVLLVYTIIKKEQESFSFDNFIDTPIGLFEDFTLEATTGDGHGIWRCNLPRPEDDSFIIYKIICYRFSHVDGSVSQRVAWDDNGPVASNSRILLLYLEKEDGGWFALTAAGEQFHNGPATLMRDLRAYTGNISSNTSNLALAVNFNLFNNDASRVNSYNFGGLEVEILGNNQFRMRGGGSFSKIGGGIGFAIRKLINGDGSAVGSGAEFDGFGIMGAPFGKTRGSIEIPDQLNLPAGTFTNNPSNYSVQDIGLTVSQMKDKLKSIPCGPRPRFFWDPVDIPLPRLPDGTRNPDDVEGCNCEQLGFADRFDPCPGSTFEVQCAEGVTRTCKQCGDNGCF